MLEIDLEIMMHHLDMDPLHRSIKQKKQNFISKRQKAISKEVDKLISASFIREVTYLD